jgi:hypothetical protein
MAEKLIVKPHRPGRVRLAVVGVAALVLVLVATAYLAGSRYYGQAMAEKREQAAELRRLRQQVAELARQKTNWEIASEVNAASLESVRVELARLETVMASQREELELYRNLLKDNGEASGLHIETLDVTATDRADRFGYRLVVRRKAALSKPVEVEVSLDIEGSSGGEPRSLAFRDVDSSMTGESRMVSFKYFKVLRGTMALPRGFEPAKVVVRVQIKGRQKTIREREFPWQVQEV